MGWLKPTKKELYDKEFEILNSKIKEIRDLKKLAPSDFQGIVDTLDQGFKVTMYVSCGAEGLGLLCEDKLSSIVFLKLVFPYVAAVQSCKERFIRGASIQRRLAMHVNLNGSIPVVYDIGDGEILYSSMQYSEGRNMRDAINAKINFLDKIKIFIAVCKTFEKIHKTGVVHSDVKQMNILIEENDGVYNPVILDWGQAKDIEGQNFNFDPVTMIGVGEALGTLPYASPTQKTSAEHRSYTDDIYSLAVVLWECLSGRSAPDVKSVHDPVFLDLSVIPSEFVHIISKARDKKVAQRYPSMKKFIAAIETNYQIYDKRLNRNNNRIAPKEPRNRFQDFALRAKKNHESLTKDRQKKEIVVDNSSINYNVVYHHDELVDTMFKYVNSVNDFRRTK